MDPRGIPKFWYSNSSLNMAVNTSDLEMAILDILRLFSYNSNKKWENFQEFIPLKKEFLKIRIAITYYTRYLLIASLKLLGFRFLFTPIIILDFIPYLYHDLHVLFVQTCDCFVLQIRIIPRAMGLKILKFRPTLPLYLHWSIIKSHNCFSLYNSEFVWSPTIIYLKIFGIFNLKLIRRFSCEILHNFQSKIPKIFLETKDLFCTSFFLFDILAWCLKKK